MRIKFLSLLLIFTGIILISGCVDKETQSLDYGAPGNFHICSLERNIFYPYAGLLNHEGPGEMVPHDSLPGERHPDPESNPNLKDATSLLDSNIEKAETITERLEEGIERLKAEGEDVSTLEALLGEYKLHIEEAKKYRALAAAEEKNNNSIANLENSSPKNQEREYLIRSQRSMIQANHVLKEIFIEFQSVMPGSEELNSTSLLNASGEGRVFLTGNFVLDIHLEDGVMAIPEISPDSEVYIKGDYIFEEEETKMQDRVLVYHIQSADVKILGSYKTVMLGGKNITLNADGAGYSAFVGNGTYRVEDREIIKEEKWGTPFFEERINLDKPEDNGRVKISSNWAKDRDYCQR